MQIKRLLYSIRYSFYFLLLPSSLLANHRARFGLQVRVVSGCFGSAGVGENKSGANFAAECAGFGGVQYQNRELICAQ